MWCDCAAVVLLQNRLLSFVACLAESLVLFMLLEDCDGFGASRDCGIGT